MIAKTMQRARASRTTSGSRTAASGASWARAGRFRTAIERSSTAARDRARASGRDWAAPRTAIASTGRRQTHRAKRRDMGAYLRLPDPAQSEGRRAAGIQARLDSQVQKTKPRRDELVSAFRRASSSKKKGSDYTAGWAVGLGKDGNYYCVPEVRDRLNLKERGDRLFDLHRKYKPKQVRYEKYGLMSDIEHLPVAHGARELPLHDHGSCGQTSKQDRIKRLIPLFEAGRIWLPESLHTSDWQKTTRDLVRDFIEEEYFPFPVGLHDDMLDSLARICEPDLKLAWPQHLRERLQVRDRRGPSDGHVLRDHRFLV
jgi:predicted phage terminase large subunit-like protein